MIDLVSVELLCMSHTEFRKKYMPRYRVTEEEVWAQVPRSTATPDEGEHLNVMLERELSLPPSQMRYFRTWGVMGWE